MAAATACLGFWAQSGTRPNSPPCAASLPSLKSTPSNPTRPYPTDNISIANAIGPRRSRPQRLRSLPRCCRSQGAAEVAVGIDLGTTNSVVATAAGGKARVVLGSEGLPVTPSVVSFGEDGGPVVGAAARKRAAGSPESTFYSVKRFIGRKYESIKKEAAQVAYEIEAGPDGEVLLKCPALGRSITPEEVCAYIIRSMIEAVEKREGAKVTKAVISVPAYFNESQREATIAAGHLAGLQSVKLIHEPVASALGYGIDLEDEQTVLVFDLGGGTLDVSVLEVGGRTKCIEVLATGGDAHLGGDDWDDKIVEWIISEHLKPRSVSWKSPSMRANLRMLAEYAKIQLSAAPNVVLRLPVGGGIRAVITQGDIDRMSVDLFRRARLAVDECCWRAGVDLEDVLLERKRRRRTAKNAEVEIRPKNREPISEVLFVGGATRMPAVRRFVRNMTGLDPGESAVDPDMAVALGAAIQAASLSGEVEDLLLVDVWQIGTCKNKEKLEKFDLLREWENWMKV